MGANYYRQQKENIIQSALWCSHEINHM
jgi:hypothetical protein